MVAAASAGGESSHGPNEAVLLEPKLTLRVLATVLHPRWDGASSEQPSEALNSHPGRLAESILLQHIVKRACSGETGALGMVNV